MRPPPLSDGAKVAIVAPAGPVARADLEAGARVLRGRFRVASFDEALERDGFFAGDDRHRAKSLQRALDSDVCAIVAARGGFGTTRILDAIDLGALAARPKWVVGCSDLTAVLLRLWTELGLISIHGPMAASLAKTDPKDTEALFALLRGGRWTGPKGLASLRLGCATGPMIGGNLTVLAHLCGTFPARAFDGAVLFLEDVGEAPYRLDRCMVQLDRCGILARAAGVVLGDLTDCPPGRDGVTARRVLEDRLSALGVPVAVGYPAAHGARNAPFLHGAVVRLRVDDADVDLEEIG